MLRGQPRGLQEPSGGRDRLPLEGVEEHARREGVQRMAPPLCRGREVSGLDGEDRQVPLRLRGGSRGRRQGGSFAESCG